MMKARFLIGQWSPYIVGGLLLYAGILKIVFPSQSVYALKALAVPTDLAKALVLTVTALELFLGSLLLSRCNLNFVLRSTLALFCGFTVFLWYLSTWAHGPSCGCLGLSDVFYSERANAVLGIVRNCAVMLMLAEGLRVYSTARTSLQTRNLS
jgi:hypothetical protein